jgi:hypothetical protein
MQQKIGKHPIFKKEVRGMKKIILGIVGILAILIIIFLLQSAPIDPSAYTPPKSQELAGVLAPNNLLQKAELLALGKINGPEEVAVDSQGRVYGGTQDGKIMCLLLDGKLETFAETKGRSGHLSGWSSLQVHRCLGYFQRWDYLFYGCKLQVWAK